MSESAGGFPLSPQQRRLWTLWQGRLDAGSDVVLKVGRAVDAEKLLRAVRAVVSRSPVLRTAFRKVSSLEYPLQFPGEADDPVDALWVERSESDRSLFLSLPALCADSRTLEHLVRRIAAEYDGREPETDELTYVQYAEWANSLLVDDESGEGIEFWKRCDVGGVPLVHLPFVPPPSASIASGDDVVRWVVPQQLVEALDSAAARSGISTASTLFAVWCALLMRLTGETSFAIGEVVEGREHEVMSAALGLFARQVPVRVSMRPDQSFSEAARGIDKLRESALQWSDYFPCDNTASISFGFQYEQFQKRHAVADDELIIDARTTRIDGSPASLLMTRNEDGMSVEVQFAPAHMSRADAKRLLRYLQNLVQATALDGEISLRSLPLLDDEERTWLIKGLNATDMVPSRHECFHDWFSETAAAKPDAIAVVYEDQMLTFAQLEKHANQLAHHLQRLGVRPEARVGVLMDRSLETLVAVLAIWKAGGAYVPLDPMRAGRQLAFLLADAGIQLVLIQQSLRAVLPEGSPPSFALDADASMLRGYPRTAPLSAARGSHLAYVIYTSGSTGVPKGVMVCHGSLVNLTGALQRAIYAGGVAKRVGLNASLTFDASIKQIATLALGMTLDLIPEAIRSDGLGLLQYLDAHGVDVLDCTPFQFRLLLQAGWGEEGIGTPRYVLLGGESIDTALLRILQADTRTTFFNLYGPTECTVDVAIGRVADDHAEAVVGRPIANVRAYVLDAAMNPVPQGVVGELFVGGRGVARGYLGRPGLTATRFVADPFAKDGRRLYRTGDLASLQPDGALRVLGRVDRQIKIRGYRIEPGEIEAVLRQQAGVHDAAVVVHEDPAQGRHLVGYVVVPARESIELGKLRDDLRELLPEFMVPSRLMRLASLPVTASGKLDRLALPLPDAASPTALNPYVAPRSDIETDIAQIWEAVLGVGRVGMRDNFFDLGGHSLLMARVHTRLRKRFDREVPMIELFRHPTVELLAGYFAGQAVSSDTGFDRALQRAAKRLKRRDGGGGATHA